jgi:hypothetical protein
MPVGQSELLLQVPPQNHRPGAPGWSCTKDGDCEAGGTCIRSPGSNAQVCSVRCDPARSTCPTGFACQNTSGVDFYCLQTPPSPGGSAGCATAPGAFDDAPAVSAAIVAALLALRGAGRRAANRG